MSGLLKSKIIIDYIIVFFISAFFCLYNISTYSFNPGDSARHSIVVQNMVKSGDYLHPKLFNDEPYYNKPPFKFWIVAAVVHFFGESHFTYRIVDRIIGIIFLLTVFVFTYKLFHSREVAYFSFLTLLGTHILFYGHGIRDTVQDPMMLLLITWALICSWYFYKIVFSKEMLAEKEYRKLNILGISGGVFVGLATVTKNIVGFYPFVILFFFLLINKKLMPMLRKVPRQLILTVGISCLLLPLYMLSQWEYIHKLIADLFMTEIYYRSTQGFHYVNHNWFYWKLFFARRVVIHPYILLGSLAYAAYRIFKSKDDRVIFILTWAVVPVFLQNLANSKLRWYILPSVPAIAMLAGLFLGNLLNSLKQNCKTYFQRKNFSLLPLIFIQILILCLALDKLSDYIAQVCDDFLPNKRKHAIEKTSNEIVEYGLSHRQKINFVYYHQPAMVSNEVFYFSMQPIVAKYAFSLDDLKKIMEEKKVDFVISDTEHYPEVIKLGNPKGFIKFPKDKNRQKAIVVIVYNDQIKLERLRPLAEYDQ